MITETDVKLPLIAETDVKLPLIAETDVKPYTEAQLSNIYHNQQLLHNQRYVSAFLQVRNTCH